MQAAGTEPQRSAQGSTEFGPWSSVVLGAPAPWVDIATFDRSIPAKEGAHFTHLLWERQVHVEAETSFHSTATRLESTAAVQHQSQWRLNLDPRLHRLTVHWLRVIRD